MRMLYKRYSFKQPPLRCDMTPLLVKKNTKYKDLSVCKYVLKYVHMYVHVGLHVCVEVLMKYSVPFIIF